MPIHLLPRATPHLVAALVLAAAVPLAQAQELIVSAAASLVPAMQAAGAAFTQGRPGARIVVNGASSGALLQQIRQGAPADVFISADAQTMDAAVAQNLMAPGTRADIAANALVAVAPIGSNVPVASLADLAAPLVQRIAIGNAATVPAGRYARMALAGTPYAAALEPKFIPADNVRQALAYVARGEVDAGFVYRTDALADAGKVRIAFDMPNAPAVRYPAAVVRATAQAALAAAFVTWLRTPAAQAELARFGFLAP